MTFSRPPDAIDPDDLILSASEEQFQRMVVREAYDNDWAVYHHDTKLPTRYRDMEGRMRRARAMIGKGFPDLVLVREKVIFAELKSERGSLSREQKAWRDVLKEAGQEYYLWRPRHWNEIQGILSLQQARQSKSKRR